MKQKLFIYAQWVPLVKVINSSGAFKMENGRVDSKRSLFTDICKTFQLDIQVPTKHDDVMYVCNVAGADLNGVNWTHLFQRKILGPCSWLHENA